MKDYPAIRFTVLFIAGIVLGQYIRLSIEVCFVLLGCSIFTSGILYFTEKRKSRYSLTSVLVLLIFFLLGYTSENIEWNSRVFIPDSVNVIKKFTVYGSIDKIDLPHNNEFSFLLSADSLEAPRKIVIPVNLLCRVYDDSCSEFFAKLSPGNVLKVTGTYRRGRDDRNPGEFDYNEYLHSRNISGTVSIYSVNDITVRASTVNRLSDIIFTARKELDKIIGSLHSPETAALLRGLILADRSDISYETKKDFINAGTIHVLAVSGLHVGFIAIIFYTLLGRLNLYIRSFMTIAGLLIFMFITGIPASVFRATVMALVVITAFISNRSTNIYNSLAIAALIILIINPAELFNPGFQLSFSAVLAIAYFYPLFRKFIDQSGINNKTIKYVILFIAVSISAQIGTLPFTLQYFRGFSVIAVLANIIVIPLTGIIIGTASVTLLLYPFSIYAATVYASANNLFSTFLYKVIGVAGNLEYSFIGIRNFTSWDTFIFCFLLISTVYLIKNMQSAISRMIFLFLVCANIILYSTLDDPNILAANKLNIFMIDVGQGDSFLIRFPDGETALIDAGNATQYFDNGERVILPLLDHLGIDKIDYGFVSHIDADHYGGFVSLIEKGKIRSVYKPLPDSNSEKDIRFERFLKQKNIPDNYYTDGIIRAGNAEIFILNDNHFNVNDRVLPNDRSGILKIVYGNTSFLFTGDLDAAGERYYREKYENFLDVDVLKAGHHGSKTSSSPDFLEITSPQISLISCGINNSFGHPSEEVMDRLNSRHSQIYRTDKEGGILLQSDGLSINKIDWKNYY